MSLEMTLSLTKGSYSDLDLWRGPEAGEDLPDLSGDVHGGDDLVVQGRVRCLAGAASLRVAKDAQCQEDDGQQRDEGHPDMRTLLTSDQ